MGYLTLQDYYNRRIQKTQLDQITGNRDVVRLSSELEAQAEVISYLIQKYDVDEEFTDTRVWNMTYTYYADSRFILDATAYSPTSTYAVYSMASINGKVYQCQIAITVPEVFNIAKWTLIGDQYALCYVDKPYNAYNSKTYYELGDFVYYKNKIYKCATANMGILPTDTNYGNQYWGSGLAYSFTGIYPNTPASSFGTWNNSTTYVPTSIVNYGGVIYICVNTNTNITPSFSLSWIPVKWVFGDNRSQQMVGVMLDLTIIKIHNLIAPNNVPQVRKDNADYGIEWLKSASGRDSAITADIPLLQPNVGKRIRWGSNTKNINAY